MRYTPGRCVRVRRKGSTSKGASSLTLGFIQHLPSLCEYIVEHSFCQTARIRVVSTAMIRINQTKELNVVHGRMTEFVFCLAHPERLDDSPVRNTAQCHNDRVLGQGLQLVCKIRIAGIDLGTHWLVIRWQAFHSIRDPAVDEFKSIICSVGMVPAGETVFVQHLIKEYSRMIASKWTARSIRSVHPGRKTNDQEACIAAAERRYRPAVIVGITLVNVIKKLRKSRALSAFFVEYLIH